MISIFWTKLASEDLQEVYDYISRGSIKYADRFVDNLFERVDTLEKFPRLGRIVPEFASENLRELIYGNYRLVYEIISETEIHMIRVHHSARLLK